MAQEPDGVTVLHVRGVSRELLRDFDRLIAKPDRRTRSAALICLLEQTVRAAKQAA